MAVADLGPAAGAFLDRYGLHASPGGRHPGRGTANVLVPLGGCYLELIAVVDPAEAAGNPGSARVAAAVAAGRTFAAWAVRVPDLDAARAELVAAGLEPGDVAPGARVRPDGSRLEWRTLETGPPAASSPLPFLIEWRLDPALYPGRPSASVEAMSAAFVSARLAHPDPEAVRGSLALVLGPEVAWSAEPGPPGLVELTFETASGPLIIG